MLENEVHIKVSDGASIPDPNDTRLITAWSVSFVGAISILAYLAFSSPDIYWRLLKLLPKGLLTAFKITSCSMLCSLPMGLLVGIGRLSKIRIINLIASTYVEVIRGIPLLVQLVFFYYALGRLFLISDFYAAVMALSICYSAYMGEVFRAGISAINTGQTEAARSLGFNRFQTMFLIVLPQAMRTILPPVGNEFIAMLKDTSLVSVLAMTDLLQISKQFANENGLPFEAYATVALVFLIITLIMSKCVSLMEGKLSYYDRK
ncbi:amino acid ABC transporter permease [Desulfovibrio litoralis]|uniref:Glutamate/aspartate import permease protein GltK n=1 Tax=Desulfovibrio litoralis DSM 11393 TaxID=1121455 RepID=A0A1M7TJ58_9BACT|nr:amino acid ABC transporter permease [Desulfovibrio litoralis]SHN70673.1 amino acid ABC transporter membrane protein, PAAT family [Desulfovibrio litoralis DSM 11393]